ncbi:hypothetical protein EG68_08577 [Paragonimus skrjabini miyazakii]|uniref:BSD domain-containing protein n=1 Tax=Paragonimus skrjabini miyazakii TaxID=59628 RepID=A0A8S9YDL4_9TREM|nr:hypothetical protein EG68_08577 [Paragonimus skrjabini miyazakii]
MNSLASFGGGQSEIDVNTSLLSEPSNGVKTVIVEDVPQVPPPSLSPSVELTHSAEAEDLDADLAFTTWFTGLTSRTEEAWKQMKHDFHEIVSVISTEPKDAVTRTASSVRQHLSAVADAARNIDPYQFTILPANDSTETTNVEQVGETVAKDQSEVPSDLSNLPSLASLRSDVSQFVSGVVSTLFGSSETSPPAIKDRREARLQILRADPATYEQEPPSPPAHLGLHNYADWRAAYFDEVTCQPRPGIPLCGARDTDNRSDDSDGLLEPAHLSPEELLEQNPFMRTYLSQLVRVEGQAGGEGITDADFWSRYYYRVWLLDVTEARRRRLAERVGSTATRTPFGKPNSRSANHPKDSLSGQVLESELNDWLSSSDPEASSPPTSATDDSPAIVEDSISVPRVLGKRASRQRKRRGKKYNEGDREDRPRSSTTPTPTAGDAVEIRPPPPCLPSDKDCESQVLSEPDDAMTSGSSSVVVLSNSEDDPELESGTVRLIPRSSFAGATSLEHTALLTTEPFVNLRDTNSDGWGEFCEADMEELPTTPLAANQQARGAHHYQPQEQEKADDWDNWS